MDDRHEQGGADDGPQDREGMPVDGDHEGLGQLEQTRHPRPQQGSDETEGGRNNQSTSHTACDGLPNGPTHGRDRDEQQESRQ